jgi:glucose/arabinose dehydrogenase/cytochrome c2
MTSPATSFLRLLAAIAALPLLAAAQGPPVGDAAAGGTMFSQNCALCHAAALGPGNIEIDGQGPSLVGVFGRKAAGAVSYPYSAALSHSGLTWDAPTLDNFLTDPGTLVPGTKMMIAIPDPQVRANLIAYLQTLKLPANVKLAAPPADFPGLPFAQDPGAWQNAKPGVKHHITVADLPAPYSSKSVDNSVRYVKPPGDEDFHTTPSSLAVPPGFTVRLFAKNLWNPRCLRVAPNGDIFLAETGANRIHIFRAADGADTPAIDQIYATGLNLPFGIAFYPPGPNPQWLYVANNDTIVRFPYHSGDVTAPGPPQVVVPKLCDSPGGHTTRDIAFSLDGTRMFVSVGSSTNVAEDMDVKPPADPKLWETDFGRGAAWGAETGRACILVTDPEGKTPLHSYANGIRNGVGLAVNPTTGDLWTSVNERDGLGDNLVPEYITRVKEGGFYGWPWFYLGSHQDPRWAGARPDLAGKVKVPDVLVQAHSASLEMCFYNAASGPALFPRTYRGDVFAAEHGSYNRHNRTGYKVIRVRVRDGVPTGEYDDFLTGFVVDDTSAWGRPVGVAVAHDGALLVSEDDCGTIWRVAYSAPPAGR